MKKLILVEQATIGNFKFEAYIHEVVNNELAFSIFLEQRDRPFITFNALDDNTVVVKIDENSINHIQMNKSVSIVQRRKYFKDFLSFIISSEKKAAYMVFKDKKMTYLKDSELIISLKNKYISNI